MAATGIEHSFRVLVIDDDVLALELTGTIVESVGLCVTTATSAEAGLASLAKVQPHLVLLDLFLPGVEGLDLLDRIRKEDPGCDVILMTAHYSTESAVEAIHKGAYDYLNKPLPPEKLVQRLNKWLSEQAHKRAALQLDTDALKTFQCEGIVGRSPAVRELLSQARRIAPHYRVALVTGDTGTGKELLAQALHRLSPVSGGPFVVCNCAAITETLFESEFFGYVRGAFTGANDSRPGLAEAANTGSLFLDEIGELPLTSQAKLLRLLQTGECRRVGATATAKVNVRFIAATNRDLRRLVKERAFREDLYYRLSSVELKLPRLLDRGDDLSLLVQYFLKEFAQRYGLPAYRLTAKADALIQRYSWPGNIRELENVLSRACMVAEQGTVDVSDLPDAIKVRDSDDDEALMSLDELQQRHALRVLDRVNGNRKRAAEILGIGRATLYRMLGSDAPKVPDVVNK